MIDLSSISTVLASAVYTDFLLGLLKYVVLPVAVCTITWRFTKMKPTVIVLYGVMLWIALWISRELFSLSDESWAITVTSTLELAVPFLFYGGIGLALLDFLILLVIKSPTAKRVLPGRFANGVNTEVELKISNRSKLPLKMLVHDGLPMEAICENLPWSGHLPGGGFNQITYPLEFHERGDKYIDDAHIQYSTPLRLWTRQVRSGGVSETKIYPNYEPVVRYALLTMESSRDQMGIVMKNRVGMSKEFHQLRDYQLGDVLSQIDWKATSKRRSLISREYQEQRDQTVILAVDCGRRMRAMDGDSPQFDHCLNAMLLLSYVALRQGDHVGVLSFGGTEKWLSPVKGVQSMTTLLNHMYDYQTSTNPSDYSEAAEKLLTNQKRRALVILLTNVRGEDGDDLIAPLQKLRQRHMVMVSNLREKEVMDRYDDEVTGLEDALSLAATQIYLDERTAVLNQLERHGIHTVDATAQELPVKLANRYLAVRDGV